MGAPLRVVVVVVAPGVVVLPCSILRAFEGGDGSIEAVRSGTAVCGFAEVARGGLYLTGQTDRCIGERDAIGNTHTDSAFTPSGRSVVI